MRGRPPVPADEWRRTMAPCARTTLTTTACTTMGTSWRACVSSGTYLSMLWATHRPRLRAGNTGGRHGRWEQLRSHWASEREGLAVSLPWNVSHDRWPVGSAPALSRRVWHGWRHRTPETPPGTLTFFSSVSPRPAHLHKDHLASGLWSWV